MNIENHIKEELFIQAKENYEVFRYKFSEYKRMRVYVKLISCLIVISIVILLFNNKGVYFDWAFIIISFINFFLYFFVALKIVKIRGLYFKEGRGISFCYLLLSFSLLKKYVESNIKVQLNNGKKSFKKYQDETFLKNELRIEFRNNLSILEFLKKYQDKYFWFKLDGQTKGILESLSSINEKINLRVNKGLEIDLILPALKNLLLFEYSTINQQKAFAQGLIGDYSEGLFLDYVSEIDKLDFPEREIKQKVKRKNNLKLWINGLLHNRNILTSIITWFIVLLILFGIALIIAQQFFSIPMDSKILVGLISAPFAGSIAIALNNKRDKN